jgi:hypothetical protein
MLRWLQRPLPTGTAYAGTLINLRAVVPKLKAAKAFLSIAGTAAGISQTASAAHQVLFSAQPFCPELARS